MRKADLDLEVMPATIDDAAILADLETARDPSDPRDPVMFRFRWASRPPDEPRVDLVAKSDGSAAAFLAAGHDPWESDGHRYGWIRPVVHPDAWSAARFEALISAGESWLRQQDAQVAVVRLKENFKDELQVAAARGYVEKRRHKLWELDLVEGRERLLAGARVAHAKMNEQGVRLMTMAQDDDPDRLAKLYELTLAGERDIPTTVPWRTKPFEEWRHYWFENPGVHEDRFWIAREDDAMIGLSVIGYPPVRGVPWTFFTATSQRGRGRGVAKALKYATVAQAITLGTRRVRTGNDGENAPILHLNAEMGYRPIEPVIELHRELA